jgi:hypothetical protein
MLFYMGAQYALMDQYIETARISFEQVIYIERKDLIEHELAEWELKQLEKK